MIKLLSMAIRGAQKADTPIAVCGEMAGEVAYTRLLLGMGLREFSMHPSHVLEVKQRVLMSDVQEFEAVVNKMIKADDPDKIAGFMEKLS